MKSSNYLRNFLTKFQVAQVSSFALGGITLGTLGLINVWTDPAVAADYFGNDIIQFEQDTIVEFEFIESHGAYQSTFGVIDLDSCQLTSEQTIIFDSCDKTPLLSETQPSDLEETVYRSSSYEDDLSNKTYDFLGTPGNAVPEPLTEFEFKAGKRYAFYLYSEFNGQPVKDPVVYSTDFLNLQGNRQAVFDEESPASAQLVQDNRVNNGVTDNYYDSLIKGGILLKFDDTGSQLVKQDYQDIDFDDFVVGVGGAEDCSSPQKPSQSETGQLQQ